VGGGRSMPGGRAEPVQLGQSITGWRPRRGSQYRRQRPHRYRAQRRAQRRSAHRLVRGASSSPGRRRYSRKGLMTLSWPAPEPPCKRSDPCPEAIWWTESQKRIADRGRRQSAYREPGGRRNGRTPVEAQDPQRPRKPLSEQNLPDHGRLPPCQHLARRRLAHKHSVAKCKRQSNPCTLGQILATIWTWLEVMDCGFGGGRGQA
jgi:hypothetical protein